MTTQGGTPVRSDNLGPAGGRVPEWVFRQDAPPPDPLYVGEGDELVMSGGFNSVSCSCWRCDGRPDDGTLHMEVGYASEPCLADDPPRAWLGAVLLLGALALGFWLGRMA